MPELPDVEVMKQYVDSTSLHKKINRVEVKDEAILDVSPQTVRKHIESQSFEKKGERANTCFCPPDTKNGLCFTSE